MKLLSVNIKYLSTDKGMCCSRPYYTKLKDQILNSSPLLCLLFHRYHLCLSQNLVPFLEEKTKSDKAFKKNIKRLLLINLEKRKHRIHLCLHSWTIEHLEELLITSKSSAL